MHETYRRWTPCARPGEALAVSEVAERLDVPIEVSPMSVLRLALPASTASILMQLYRPLDQYFVQGLGKEAQGAIGSCQFVLILISASFVLVSAGTAPLVGRATGAGDVAARRRALGAAVFACLGLSVAFVGVGLVAVGPIVGQLGLFGRTAEYAEIWLRTLLLTGAGLVFAPLVTTSFNAMGRTSFPLLLCVGVVCLNAVLNPFLIARLGIAGSALGTTTAQSIAIVVGLTVLVRETGLSWSDVRPGAEVRRILHIGAPVAVATAIYALVYLAILRTSISPLGPAVNAGLGIGFGALEAVTWPMYLGGSTAIASLVGRCLGAKRPDLAWQAIRSMRIPVVALGVCVALVFRFGGPWLVGWFAADADAYREGVRYASILAFSQPFLALEAYNEGVMAGAGDSRGLFWSTVPFNLIRVPLAWILAIGLGFGAAGVWWAINFSSVLKCTAKALRVRSGAWTRLLD